MTSLLIVAINQRQYKSSGVTVAISQDTSKHEHSSDLGIKNIYPPNFE